MISVETQVEKHGTSRIEYMVKVCKWVPVYSFAVLKLWFLYIYHSTPYLSGCVLWCCIGTFALQI